MQSMCMSRCDARLVALGEYMVSTSTRASARIRMALLLLGHEVDIA